jgi:hypothetical protein
MVSEKGSGGGREYCSGCADFLVAADFFPAIFAVDAVDSDVDIFVVGYSISYLDFIMIV